MYKLTVLSLFLLSCADSNNHKTAQPKVMKNIEIQSVEIMCAGGQLGYSSRMFIDEDSTHYKQTVAANPEKNSEYHKKTVPQDWHNLIAKINLVAFRSSKEGKSVQRMDGIDINIIVASNSDTISKMNAYNNSEWKYIVEHVYRVKMNIDEERGNN
ncbi:MAG: hypothetical protein K0S24_2056 [Sphingobacterium sp.]|jgi:hypothetical protein|nr:hypothetical protein [Sphingobacterium sp.]